MEKIVLAKSYSAQENLAILALDLIYFGRIEKQDLLKPIYCIVTADARLY